jgi:hypothetical protein
MGFGLKVSTSTVMLGQSLHMRCWRDVKDVEAAAQRRHESGQRDGGQEKAALFGSDRNDFPRFFTP